MTVDDPERPSTELIHDETYPGMSRRRLLSALTGVGFAPLTASHLTTDDIDSAATDEVPIVVGFHSDDPHAERTAQTAYVPADWYNDFRHATQMKEQAADRLWKTPGVVSVGVIPGEIGGNNSRLIVRAQKSQLYTTQSTVPPQIGGVDVEFEAAGEFRQMGCADDLQHWNSSQSSIYGGYAVKGDSGNPVGTVGAAAFKNGRRYLATCQHIFSGGNSTGKTIRHPNGTALGTVAADGCNEDYAMVALNSNYYIQRDISYSGYNGISGHFSYDGLGHLRSRGVNTQKVGRSTCRTSFAGIKSIADTIYSAPGCVPKPYCVFHDDNSSGGDQKGGDSGSISFYESPHDSSTCWLISLMNYEDSYTGNVFGTGLYRLADFGYGF